jgi:eukaryotic-like serine/threonine-protein kinase
VNETQLFPVSPHGVTTEFASSLSQTNAFDIDPNSENELPPVPSGYELLGKLGEGGMGVVYKAKNIALNRIEVLKMIRAGEFASAKELARFKFEAEAAANLDHPNIVPVFGVGEASGRPYLAMRWIDGKSLADQAPPAKREAALLVAKIARAVHHAHRRGILHRDLKPANILVDSEAEPFVTDFGVARRIGADAALSQSGAIVGTPQYMAPEQARGDPNLTVGADIYALGGILYYCLTGQPPFSGKSYVDVLNQVVTSPPAAPRNVNGAVDPELEAVCLKCLEKNPADRYHSAFELADDLEHYLRGEGVSARAPGLFDWLKQLWRAQPQPSYSWEVLVWFGAILLVVHSAMFGIIREGGSLLGIWILFVACWIGVCAVLWHYMARRFRRLPPAERHSMMIAVGHALSSVALTIAVVPLDLSAPARECVGVFPPLLTLSGLGFFVVGSTHWSRFFLIALGMMALAPVAAAWPEASPLVYAISSAACLWFWAYAKKVMFGSHHPDGLGAPTS